MSTTLNERSSAPPSPESAHGVLTLVRHQLGALFTTAVDFGTMIVCVSVFGLSAVAGTALGAGVGAVTNFTLARRWVFVETAGRSPPRPPSVRPAGGQALRYAAVSVASLGWNALGEHVTHDLAHVQYIVARAMVAAIVSLAWNYPLHKNWVFKASSPATAP